MRTLIRELYNLTDLDETSVDTIALNHDIAQLDERVRKDVKMLQLAGNKSLERLLELVNDKLNGNPVVLVHDTGSNDSQSNDEL